MKKRSVEVERTIEIESRRSEPSQPPPTRVPFMLLQLSSSPTPDSETPTSSLIKNQAAASHAQRSGSMAMDQFRQAPLFLWPLLSMS